MAEKMLLNEDSKWMIVQCATFSKSLNPRNITKSVSDIRIRIRFPFQSTFWISVSGCKLTILPDIKPANRIEIISDGNHGEVQYRGDHGSGFQSRLRRILRFFSDSPYPVKIGFSPDPCSSLEQERSQSLKKWLWLPLVLLAASHSQQRWADCEIWNFSVWVQSWSDKIESNPVLIRKIFANYQSDTVLIRQCKKIFILSYEAKEGLELFCLHPNTIGWRQNSSSRAFASWGKIDTVFWYCQS